MKTVYEGKKTAAKILNLKDVAEAKSIFREALKLSSLGDMPGIV